MAVEQGQAPFFLKRGRDIQYIKQHGRRVSTGAFNLQFCPMAWEGAMLGIVVGADSGLQ